jgi:hypothetical protein
MEERMEFAVLGVAAGAIIYPLARFIRSVFFPRSVAFYDHDGQLLGEISPERVQQTNLADLERLHDRIQRDRHVRIRSVA